MRDWTEVIGKLDEAKRAREEFLLRGVVDEWIIGPMLLDRLAEDLGRYESICSEFNESAADGSGCR